MTRRVWTEEEDAYIRTHYIADGAASVARHLDRTSNSIRQRASQLGATRKPEAWTEEKEEYIVRNYAAMTNTRMAAALDTSMATFHNRVAKLIAEGRIERKQRWSELPSAREERSDALSRVNATMSLTITFELPNTLSDGETAIMIGEIRAAVERIKRAHATD